MLWAPYCSLHRCSAVAIADLQEELQRSRSLVRLLEERERGRAPALCTRATAAGVCSRALSTALLANANAWVPPPLSTVILITRLISHSSYLFSHTRSRYTAFFASATTIGISILDLQYCTVWRTYDLSTQVRIFILLVAYSCYLFHSSVNNSHLSVIFLFSIMLAEGLWCCFVNIALRSSCLLDLNALCSPVAEPSWMVLFSEHMA